MGSDWGFVVVKLLRVRDGGYRFSSRTGRTCVSCMSSASRNKGAVLAANVSRVTYLFRTPMCHEIHFAMIELWLIGHDAIATASHTEPEESHRGKNDDYHRNHYGGDDSAGV